MNQDSQRKPSQKIRFKLFVSVAAVVLLFIVISSYLSVKKTGSMIIEQLDSHGSSVLTLIANSNVERLLAWDFPAIQTELDLLGESEPQILRIEVFHGEKEVASYQSSEYEEQMKSEILKPFSYSTPVIAKTSDEEGGIVRDVGTVKLVFSKQRYKEFLASELQKSLYYALFLLVADTFLSYTTVVVLILKPLREIIQGTEIIGRGNLDYRIEIDKDDEIGNLANAINSMTSNLKMSHVALEEAKNKTAAIIANLADPIIVINNQKIMLFNPAARKEFRLTDSDLGKLLIHSNDPDCLGDKFCLCDFRNIIKLGYISKVKKTDENNFPISEELVVDSGVSSEEVGDEGKIIYNVVTSPVRDASGVYFGHMKVFHDLTRERMIDNLKSRFITIAAHQLRTPLSGIKWSLKMVLEEEMGSISAEAKEYLTETYSANERMIRLVNDLLNIAHIEEGNLLKDRILVSVNNVIRETLDTLSVKLQKNNIKVDFKTASLEIPKVLADRSKIKVAMQNLIDNAIKYSPQGSVVEIETGVVEDGGKQMVEVRIKDSGIGISKKDQKKIFSKFFRTDNAVKTVPEGSGFGLFITKNIIKAHSGKIWFESEPEKGTTFFIRLTAGDTLNKMSLESKQIKEKGRQNSNNSK